MKELLHQDRAPRREGKEVGHNRRGSSSDATSRGEAKWAEGAEKSNLEDIRAGVFGLFLLSIRDVLLLAAVFLLQRCPRR